MRLRNRIVKASFYNDPDLCRWERDKRSFYQSLWACAEDSCCLEDDMFGVKLAAWPSPLDTDMSVERFEAWRDELVSDGKLIAYEVRGKRYLFIPGMAEHETPRNPQRPDCDLPLWITWVPNDKDPRKGSYVFDDPSTCDDVVQALYEDCTSVVQASPPRPAPPRTVLNTPLPPSGGGVCGEALTISEEQRSALTAKWGRSAVDDVGEQLALHIASTGKRYRSHAATLEEWLRRKGFRPLTAPPERAPCSDPDCSNGWLDTPAGAVACTTCGLHVREAVGA